MEKELTHAEDRVVASTEVALHIARKLGKDDINQARLLQDAQNGVFQLLTEALSDSYPQVIWGYKPAFRIYEQKEQAQPNKGGKYGVTLHGARLQRCLSSEDGSVTKYMYLSREGFMCALEGQYEEWLLTIDQVPGSALPCDLKQVCLSLGQCFNG